ncbi:tetratricopeptide repeat protein [Alishewanella sp. d11]|uniref:tetratricopeptide repeat protein n=1 Tax=Alishewanella sp. d11 TaxID=3414030 RepID=UPI003BF79566
MRFLVVLLVFGCLQVQASENLSDHEQFCETMQETSCEHYLQQQLAALPAHSANWYRVQGFYLDYLYDKHQFEELKTQVESILPQPNLPEVLKVQLYFYYAKVLFYFEQPEAAKHYAGLAQHVLQEVYDSFGNPLRLVELANLYYTLNELNEAEKLLRFTQSHYLKSRDPLFLFELASNLALIHHSRQDLQGAAQFREEALLAAQQLGHAGKLIVAMGNLARTYQLLGQFAQAQRLYEASLTYTSAPEYSKQHSIYLLRLAELGMQQHQLDLAKQYLAQVKPEQLAAGHLTLFKQLAAQLGGI